MIDDLLSRLINHPDILPYVAPCASCILTPDAPWLHLVGGERGAILLDDRGGVVEWHWLCTNKVRGRAALELARRAIQYAFTTLNAKCIIGSTPRTNCAARFMNRALGAKVTGKSIDSQGRECVDYRLERASWVISSRLAGQS